ncbi:hypothetical protein [Paenibacillus polymyxa]|uniref:Uncharacterized protein n=1 Tax=Paenibacillus polymyxa (strain SC2) TaxID=886882 RepID=E3EID8_PAEPS|nr:hypothetical protein [Paenibacillus polymyxa]ADO55251.1 hypothetical protein PPSC2_06130 [Paenibacillus polymyxa SC2]WPQ58058.1 hypothetical protein SKN87_06270 [Paenibacillus polymyxa]CCC84097.1 hypothetical protein PPM_1160 [Paenibacillus polymyxa M1]
MNVNGALRKFFRKVNRENVEKLMKEKGVFPTDKKIKSKRELYPYFMELESIVSEEEVVDLVEMAVHVKTKGLPAFTHKLANKDFFVGKTPEELSGSFEYKVHPIGDIYTISTKMANTTGGRLKIDYILKKYEESWRNGELNIESLSAVYKSSIDIDLEKNILTIFAGDDETHSIIETFIGMVLKLPIQTYRIKASNTTLSWEQNASYLTALFLDFVFNRLKNKGIESSFSHIKFKIASDDIKEVTINGKNILNSYLACEYVVLGRDIIQFKTSMVQGARTFSCNFELKGSDLLKIVVLDISDENLKEQIMRHIQEEYILMCEQGIVNYKEISKLLEKIYERFMNKEKLFQDTLRENLVSSISQLGYLLEYTEKNDLSKEALSLMIESSKVLLENLDVTEKDSLIQLLTSWLESE